MAVFDWTDELEARVVEMWNAGKSSGEIQRTLKIPTRNMVIGKVKRSPFAIVKRAGSAEAPDEVITKAPPKKRVNKKKKEPKEKVTRLQPVSMKRVQEIAEFDRAYDTELNQLRRKASIKQDPIALPAEKFEVLSIFDNQRATTLGPTPFALARVNQCKYPLWTSEHKVGDVCGEQRLGVLSWCAHHTRLLYQAESKLVQRWLAEAA